MPIYAKIAPYMNNIKKISKNSSRRNTPFHLRLNHPDYWGIDIKFHKNQIKNSCAGLSRFV